MPANAVQDCDLPGLLVYLPGTEFCRQHSEDFLLLLCQPIYTNHLPLVQPQKIIGRYPVKGGQLSENCDRRKLCVIFVTADRGLGKAQEVPDLFLGQLFPEALFPKTVTKIINQTNSSKQDLSFSIPEFCLLKGEYSNKKNAFS